MTVFSCILLLIVLLMISSVLFKILVIKLWHNHFDVLKPVDAEDTEESGRYDKYFDRYISTGLGILITFGMLMVALMIFTVLGI